MPGEGLVPTSCPRVCVCVCVCVCAPVVGINELLPERRELLEERENMRVELHHPSFGAGNVGARGSIFGACDDCYLLGYWARRLCVRFYLQKKDKRR